MPYMIEGPKESDITINPYGNNQDKTTEEGKTIDLYREDREIPASREDKKTIDPYRERHNSD